MHRVLLHSGQQNPDGALHGAADTRHLSWEFGDFGCDGGQQTLPHAAGLPEGLPGCRRSGCGDICGAAVHLCRGLPHGGGISARVDVIQLTIGDFSPVQHHRSNFRRVHLRLHHNHLPVDDRAQHCGAQAAAQGLCHYS